MEDFVGSLSSLSLFRELGFYVPMELTNKITTLTGNSMSHSLSYSHPPFACSPFRC